MTLYTFIFTLSSELKLYCESIYVCARGFSGSVFVIVIEGRYCEIDWSLKPD